MDQITLSEENLVKVKAAVSKPAQRRTYKKLATARLRLKKNYLLAKENGEDGIISDFLCSMGHNVVSAIMTGSTKDYEETRGQDTYESGDEKDVSGWVPANEKLEELYCDNPFSDRIIGVKKPVPWRNKKCTSCKVSFNTKSNPIKCDGCDSYTHKRNVCLRNTSDKNQFYCKVCICSNQSQNKETSSSNTYNSKVDGGFKCEKCGIIVKSNYSLKRHMGRIHTGGEELQESVAENDASGSSHAEQIIENHDVNAESDNTTGILRFLTKIGLEQYGPRFDENDINMAVLLDLRTEEFMDMVKELGIASWGHRQKMKRAIEEIKKDNYNENVETFQ